MDTQQRRINELYSRLKSAKQVAIVNRVAFFFFLVVAAIDHYTGERVGEVRYLWAIVGSSLCDGAISAWARNIISDINTLKKNQR